MRALVPAISIMIACAAPCAAQEPIAAATEIPADWRRAIGAREVRLRVVGDGDWEQPEETWRRVLVLEQGDRGAETSSLRVDARTCAPAIRALRDHAPVRRIGEGPFRISIALGRIALGSRTVASVDGELCEPVMPGDGSRPSIAVLSLVGPVLTLEQWSSEHRAGGPPYHSTWWPTIDLRTGQQVSITEVVDGASLLDALRRDRYLGEVPGLVAELARAGSWSEASAALEGADLHPGGFAFVDWHEDRGVAGVRLGLHPQGCGMCPNTVVTVGLEVTPVSWMIDPLGAARAGRGHLLARGEVDTF